MDEQAAQAIVDFAARNGQVHSAKARYRFDAVNHIHLLDDKPLMGTSTVVGALGKPLTYWGAGCALTPLGWVNKKKASRQEVLAAAAEGLAKIRGVTSVDHYADLLQTCYHAHTKQLKDAAAEGTDTHAQLAAYVQSCIDDNKGEPCRLFKFEHNAVEVFSEWAVLNVRKFLWSEKHCYSEKLWVGGISDCGCVLINGRTAIIDFKRKGCYYPQHVQIGGYACQIEENGLFTSSGERYREEFWYKERYLIDDAIVFPNAGKPKTKDAGRYMARFIEILNNYKEQQEYDKE